MDFTEKELLYLHRLVDDDIQKMEGRINRLYRYLNRGDEYQKKLALAQAERDAMLPIRKKIYDEIASRELGNYWSTIRAQL